MRNKFIACAVLLIFAAAALSAQSWNTYSANERKTLAEAYWLAGKQYQVVGKTEKGREYMDLARVIDPQLDPSQIKDEALPSAAELMAGGGASPIGAGAAEIPTQSLSSFFLRFLGALLAEDAASTVGFLDGSVYVSKLPGEITRADAKSAFEKFFAASPLRGKEPSSLYNLDSMVIARASPAMQKAWGEAYTVRVDANADYSDSLSFWEARQQFFVHRVSGDWSIFAVGQNPPPLTWKPQSAAPGAPPQAPAATDAEASKGITEAFSSCLDALLKKDADGALAFMAPEVAFLRLRQTVTSGELKTSLQGYFESADFGSSQVGDVVDMDSVFIERAESPVPAVSGTVYSLHVESKMDLSKSIPFWSTHQRYYFIDDGGTWKIFAIL